MLCKIVGCKTHEFDPKTGMNKWFNFCPRCKMKLDR